MVKISPSFFIPLHTKPFIPLMNLNNLKMQRHSKLLPILFTALFLTAPFNTYAQNKKVKERDVYIDGRITDAFTHLDIQNVKVTLMSADSTVVDTVRTWMWNEGAVHPTSRFYFRKRLREGRYIFKATHPDYANAYLNYTLDLSGRKMYFQIDDFTMKRKGMADKEHALGEVVVKSTKIKMVMRGDTIVYNADAFNIPNGSMLDALIRQLPGATINTAGEIFINGRKLDYLLLNGKDFFKGNNKTLVENLPYYTVKNLQVYEKSTDKSQLMGRDVEKKDFVMDVKLKKEYEKTGITNFDLAAGSNSRYAEKMFSLYFTPRVQLSVFANLNNVNEDRKPGEKGDWDPAKLPNGQLTQKTVGLNAAVSNTKNTLRNNVSGSISWRNSDNQTVRAGESFLTSGNVYNRSIASTQADNVIVKATNKLEARGKTFIRWTTDVDYNKFNNFGLSRSATFDADPESFGSTEMILDTLFATPLSRRLGSMAVNRQRSHTMGKGHALDIKTDFGISYQLKWGDAIHLEALASYQNNRNSLWDRYQLDYLRNSPNSDYRDKYDHNPSHSYQYTLESGYLFVLPGGLVIVPGYHFSQKSRYNNNEKYRLDRIAGWQTSQREIGSLPSTRDSMLMALDAANSYSGNKFSIKHSPNLSISYSKQEQKRHLVLNLNLTLNYESERLDFRSQLINTQLRQHNCFFQPMINGSFGNGRINSWCYFYTQVNTPDLYQRVERRDDANPLAVTQGNPDLKSSITHRFQGGLSDRHTGRLKWPSVYVLFTIRDRAVANGFTYEPSTGVYTYKPENVNGNWDGRIDLNHSLPLDSAGRFTWDNRLSYSYERNVDLTAVSGNHTSVLSKVDNHLLNHTTSFNYQNDGLRLSLEGQWSRRNARRKLSDFTPITTYDFHYGLIGSYKFAFGLETGMDLKMFSRRGYDVLSMNTNDLVCNAYVSQSFLKGKLTAKVDAFDLFHRLSSVSYEINGQGKSELRYNTTPHYVMFHLLYKINIGNKK